MAHEIGPHILEVRSDEAVDLFRALGLASRVEILKLLAADDRNINELGAELGLSQSTVTRHVQQLEQAGLVTSEYVPGLQGMQKRCRLRYSRLIVTLDVANADDDKVDEVSMPIGLYTLVSPGSPCGLANRTRFIGFLDKAQSFYDPDRASAEILWMANGFVEYTFPNDLPTSMEVERLEFSMEVCSEAPDYNHDWPSDLTLWVNGVEVGTWTCPGDFGGKRGLLNPSWWVEHMTQFGLLKYWSVDRTGTYVDGTRVSDVDLSRLMVVPQQPISVRLGVKPDAEHQGGFNLFGKGFGNYAQDLVLRLHYDRKSGSVRRGEPTAAVAFDRSSLQEKLTLCRQSLSSSNPSQPNSKPTVRTSIMQRSNRAFTLIELLVVIAIIAILAAILFPVFAQAKAAAKKTSDLSNQKQIATANLLYSGDSDDNFVSNGEGLIPSSAGDWTGMTPFTGEGGGYWGPVAAGAGGDAPNSPLGFMDPVASQNWGREMYPYIKSMDLLVSPGAQNDVNAKFAPVRTLPAGVTGTPGRTSYAMNGCASGKSQTAVARPSETIVFQSRATTTKEAICLPRRAHFGDGWTGTNDADWQALGFNFNYGGNYAYADGHAGFKKRNAVQFRAFGFFEWVNVEKLGGWTPPSKNPTMSADPTKNYNPWYNFGACDVTQEPWNHD